MKINSQAPQLPSSFYKKNIASKQEEPASQKVCTYPITPLKASHIIALSPKPQAIGASTVLGMSLTGVIDTFISFPLIKTAKLLQQQHSWPSSFKDFFGGVNGYTLPYVAMLTGMELFSTTTMGHLEDQGYSHDQAVNITRPVGAFLGGCLFAAPLESCLMGYNNLDTLHPSTPKIKDAIAHSRQHASLFRGAPLVGIRDLIATTVLLRGSALVPNVKQFFSVDTTCKTPILDVAISATIGAIGGALSLIPDAFRAMIVQEKLTYYQGAQQVLKSPSRLLAGLECRAPLFAVGVLYFPYLEDTCKSAVDRLLGS